MLKFLFMSFNFVDGIIYAKTLGIVDFNYMKSRIELVLNDVNLPSKIKILEVANGVLANFSSAEIEELTNLIRIMALRFESIHHAVVHDNPVNTAYAMLLADLASGTSYYLTPFSTVEAAKVWLIKK